MKLAFFSIVNDGEISSSDIYYLDALKKIFDEIIVTANFVLENKDIELLKAAGIIRYYSKPEFSVSLSQWAFAMSASENQDLLKNSEEILFCTENVYGPVYSLSQVWSNALAQEADAWGLLRKEKYQDDGQSSEFFVVKRKTIDSSIFRNYWRSVNNCTQEEIKNGFVHLGLYLQKNGFNVKYLMDQRFNNLCNNPEILLADDLLFASYPFVNKLLFRQDTEKLLADTNAAQCGKAFNFIQSHTKYPIDLMVHDLTKNLENSDLIQRLHLAYVVPDDKDPEDSHQVEHNKAPKCAVILFTFYADLLERNLKIIDQIPDYFKIVIVTSNDDLFTKWQDLSKKIKNIEVRKQINRGRNESCYWITCRDIIETYDYICLMHDKKTNYWGGLPVRGYTYAYNAINNLVKTRSYINNIVDIFERNKFIGLLMPFPPMFCGLDCVINDPWSSNRAIAKELYKELNLSIPMDHCPRSPWGGMFWIRGSAMSSLLRKQWNFDDFPPEPVQPDGTILHTLERMYPMLAQDAGYLSAFICPSSEYRSVYFNTYSLLKTKDAAYRRLKSELQNKDSGSQSDAQQNAGNKSTSTNATALSNSVSPDDDIVRKNHFYDLWIAKSRCSLIKHKLKHERRNILNFFSLKTELWDSEYYLQENPDVKEAGADPLEHYIEHGWKEGRNPSKSCSTAVYLRINPDCRLLGISPLEHYYLNCKQRMIFRSFSDVKEYMIKHGIEILKKSSKFDKSLFLKQYSKKYGKIPEGFDPYSYYLEHGAYETLKPSAHFRVHSYFDRFPDLQTYGICPVIHYELIGKYL